MARIFVGDETEFRRIYEGREPPRHEPLGKVRSDLAAVLDYAADPFRWRDEDSLSDVWVDLRYSEAIRLNELLDAAVERATDAAMEGVKHEIVAAALAFAAEHPNAPRVTGRREDSVTAR